MKAALSAVTAICLLASFGTALAQERETTTNPRNQFGDDAGTAAAAASDGAARTPSELLAAGYEIRSVTIVPHDIVLRGGSTIDVDAVILMLQNGPSAAQCYVTYESYVNRSYFAGVPSCTVME